MGILPGDLEDLVAVGGALRGRLAPLLFLGGLYVVLSIALVIPRITADGVAYYAQTRSILLDGDLDLANEYDVPVERYSPGGDAGPRAVVPRDADGTFEHAVNLGIVALFGPFLVAGHAAGGAVDAVAGVLGMELPPISMDGFGLPSVLGVSFGTNALVAAGLGLVAIAIRPAVGGRIATAAAVATWLGTSLLFWSTQRPAHAHAPLVAIEGAFVAIFLLRARDPNARIAWFALGLAWGLMLTVRPITILYGLLPAALLAWVVLRPAFKIWVHGPSDGAGRLRATWAILRPGVIAGILFLIGSAFGRLPAVLFGHDVSLFGAGYYTDTAYLRGGFDGDPIRGLLDLAFDPTQGAAWWVPLLPLAVLGLMAMWWRDRLIALTGAGILIAIAGFAALLGTPERFGGFGISSRHLVEATPAIVIGVAGILAAGRDLAGRLGAGLGRSLVAAVVPVLVVLATLWSVLAHLAGAVVEVAGASPAERVAAILERPVVLGRLWFTPATGTAAEGKVYLGGQLAQAVANGDPGAALGFVAGLAWALAIGLAVGIGAVVVARRLPDPPPRDPSATAPDVAWPTDPDRGLGRSPTVGRSVRRAALGLARSARPWAPWLVLAGILIAATAPAFAQPGDIRDGAPVTLRTWNGVSTNRPTGVVTTVVYGFSPSGNAVVLPPTPARPNTATPVETVTRGTFATIGTGREVIVAAPDLDALAQVDLWFGPTFDPDASVVVTVGWTASTEPVIRAILTAEDLALGTVPVQAPMRLREAGGDELRIRVEPVAGAPAPEVSVRGDGSLAYRFRGFGARPLAEISVDGAPFLPGADPSVSLPESGSLTLDEQGARMRIGPWGPEQLLRWSNHTGWVLPGPTTVPGTWGDSIAREPDAPPLEVPLEAPLPIRSVTVHMLVTSYGVEPAGEATIAVSSDGATFRPIAVVSPDVANRQVAVTGTLVLAEPTDLIWVRLDADPETGPIGINGAWFDLDLALDPATTAIGTARTEDVEVVAATAEEPRALLRIEAAGGPGRVNLVLRTAGAVVVAAAQAAGPWILGGVVIAMSVTAAALARRRDGAIPVSGLVGLAALSMILAIALAPRTVALPAALPLDDGSAVGWQADGEVMVAGADGGTFSTPTIAFPPGTVVQPPRVVGDGSVSAGLRRTSQPPPAPAGSDPVVVTDDDAGAVVDVSASGPATVDAVVLRADPWATR